MTDGNAGLSRRGFLTAAGTAVAAAGTAAAQEDGNTTAGNETTTASGNQTMSGNETASGDESAGGSGSGSSGGVEREVIVGPEGELVFDPETVEVTPGSTVTWVWESDNHNVVPDGELPEGASWEGTGGDSETFDTGYEYSHTFTELGTYDYVCVPHASVGMVGAVEVVEELSSGGGEGGGSNIPQVPDSAKSLGVATTFSMISVLGLAYFFMKYGGDYETPDN
ncbi:Tat (twin-arginine translocation) pathway signal sequence [Halogranum gelatinilyticum]|uniref:Tat (Twin-arginine translocation) pathway signal sequence n=1 Tax=Halogranum gelatinilyticum TaxID=660521 RepID=A0A1G9QP20_9EURY|nr:plastocyanin/azurin family copper-binding protein [Halogranum gelatinilyticum]SDM12327.1 Tat (twin-arginine translocation) pathway signal sequence [Halogranum gelatinilyticum]